MIGRIPLHALRATLQGVLKAPFVIRQNLSALLAARKETPSALARYVGKHKTWISQFLTGKRDELQLGDLDKIAAFFGIATYQLFQPGISRLTERRSSIERRTGQERRVGHNRRLLESLQSELNKVPHFSRTEELDRHGATALPSPVYHILTEAERRIAQYYATHSPEGAPVGQTRATLATRRRRNSPGSDAGARKKVPGNV